MDRPTIDATAVPRYIYSDRQYDPIPTLAWTDDGAFEVAFHQSGLIDIKLGARRYALRKNDDTTLTVWLDGSCAPDGRSLCRGQYPCAFTPARSTVADIHVWIADWARAHD